MKRVYGAFLSLYPREYRELFGPEVLNVFAQAAEEHRARGFGVWAWFMLSELSGAVISAASHWVDRFSVRRQSAVPGPAGARPGGLFNVVQGAESDRSQSEAHGAGDCQSRFPGC